VCSATGTAGTTPRVNRRATDMGSTTAVGQVRGQRTLAMATTVSSMPRGLATVPVALVRPHRVLLVTLRQVWGY
jgi:hypothetical protein